MAGVDEIWPEAVRTLEGGKPFALATVINVRGSTPREVGAKMIVRDDGQFGTIGGGCGEAEVFRKARLLLGDGSGARLVEVDLTGDFDQQQIGTCGGLMDVFIDLWKAPDLPIARKLAEAAAHNKPAALLTVVDPGLWSETPAGSKTVILPSSNCAAAGVTHLGLPELDRLAERAADAVPGLLEAGPDGGFTQVTRIASNGAPQVFLDPITGAQRLIIVGAGHIAQPLCELGAMLGFYVTILDDRASFANRERFPKADQIIVKPFGAAIASLKLDRHCSLISVTRGHAFDEEALRAALQQPCGFIGMIGSRRRVRATLARLEEEGFDPQRLDEIHAPLGLDIGAETPEEIAIAIIAEIIRERRTGIRDDFALGAKSGRLRRSIS
ncbi:MAG: XdhC family protein [Candidatus Binataceae bacterium]|jgi:xanthine dehydrogenase accessory factor